MVRANHQCHLFVAPFTLSAHQLVDAQIICRGLSSRVEELYRRFDLWCRTGFRNELSLDDDYRELFSTVFVYIPDRIWCMLAFDLCSIAYMRNIGGDKGDYVCTLLKDAFALPSQDYNHPIDEQPPIGFEDLRCGLARIIRFFERRNKRLARRAESAGLAPLATLASEQPLAESKQDEIGGEKPVRMTVEQANKRAMQLAKQMKEGFFSLSEREQARRIGCSWVTWGKTEFYAQAQKRRARQPRSPERKATSFTSHVEAVTGEGDRNEVLNQLIAEQEADSEPSPLEDDPPDSKPKKVRERKLLVSAHGPFVSAHKPHLPFLQSLPRSCSVSASFQCEG